MGFSRSQHCVFSLRYHLVIVTKYRRKVITKKMVERLNEIFSERRFSSGISTFKTTASR